MADNDGTKPLPAWQQAYKQQQQPTAQQSAEDTKTRDGPTQSPEDAGLREVEIPTPAEPAAVAAADELGAEDSTPTLQIQHMKTFLEDPAVQNAPMEKKRAFFESKGISKEQIDQVLKAADSPLNASEFVSFQQANAPSIPLQPPKQTSSGPPIITYPEFLVEAHKPPPLITPARVINTAYVVSGLAAILYGASKYLVTPMSASLSEARHEFATHSQSKIDQMNEKLEGLVSKVPDAAKKEQKDADDASADNESDISDPTELYHRDMGTQTSPPRSRRSSSSGSDLVGKKDEVTRSTHGLEIMQSHLDEMLQQSQGLELTEKERDDKTNKLRNYLDTLTYSSPTYGMWNSEGEQKDKAATKEDLVEELKKEIRGVKGVLLSAKRFPGVAGRTAVT
jgi:hypothetical protein